MRARKKEIVTPTLHQVADIYNEGSVDRRNFNPVAADAFHLKAGLRRLPDSGENLIIPMRSDADLADVPARFLWGIVAGAHSRHRLGVDVVEILFVQIQGERKGAQHDLP